MRTLRAAGIAAVVAVQLLGGMAPASAAAVAIATIAAAGGELALEANRGMLVRLPAAAAAVLVANPEIADVVVKSPTLVHVIGKRAGETTLIAVDAADVVLANATVRVTHNLAALAGALGSLLPGSAVTPRTVAGGLVLTGTVASAVEAEEANRLAAGFVAQGERVVNQLRFAGPNQVNLRVRVAEVSRDTVKRLGFNFDVIPTIGSITFGLATGRLPAAGGAALTRANGENNVFARSADGNIDVSAVIDALETEGLVTMLAEPNLTALSGETASFLAGGEFPIPVVQGDGSTSVEFKKFGVALAFTPTVLDAGRVSLRVAPEVSALSNAGAVTVNGFSIPALTARRAETTVELGSGQSLAIAGLLQNNTAQDVREFPWLADLPIIGALFRSTEFSRDETELVILVTPYLVRPSSTALAVPTDGFRAPDDAGRVLGGETWRQRQPGRPVPATPRLAGPVGFIVD
ncbi:MAG: type II and III secretion system protein family protein [Alphaproteobacteria bacterium]